MEYIYTCMEMFFQPPPPNYYKILPVQVIGHMTSILCNFALYHLEQKEVIF